MFPRRFFPGRYYAPVYWPQSQGIATNIFNADIELESHINRTASLTSVVSRTASLNSTVNRGPNLESELS